MMPTQAIYGEIGGNMSQRLIRVMVLSVLLAFFAFATMAPHFRTWDIVRASVQVETVPSKIVALDFTPSGNTLHGDAEITLKGRSEKDGGVISGTGLMQFQARCISPLCGGFVAGPVELQGEVKIKRGDFGGTTVQIQGILRGQVQFVTDETSGEIIGFRHLGLMSFHARVSSQ
jgi:hypothetical protein